MSDFGVQPSGFVRKSLAQILTEIEADNVRVFGVGVVQTPQSVLGQLNGLIANFAAQLWEEFEGVYQSFDPAQAEGLRINELATIRNLTRLPDETDDDFRARLINTGREKTSLLAVENAIRQVSGVTFVRVYANETSATTDFGVPPQNLAVAVIGGDDAAVARAVYEYSVEGLPSWGNYPVEIIDDGGFARTVFLTRPVPVSLALDLVVTRSDSRRSVAVPSHTAIKALVLDALKDLPNGETISSRRVASLVQISGVDIVEARIARDNGRPIVQTIRFDFTEIPVVTDATLQLIWTP